MRKVRIGFVGVGNISGIYLENLTKEFREVEIIGVCDLIRERAEKAVKEYNIPKLYGDMYELFADPEVDIVLNITQAVNHYAVTKAAILAGKNVYSEKPLATELDQARELVKLAREHGVMLGGAPDTCLGGGIQTCRKLIDMGVIGEVIGADAHMICRGPEAWHPDPEFFYERGGGPMLDMGPYYMTALVNLLGRCSAVTGFSKKTYTERLITSEPKCGTLMPVSVDTFVTGSMLFESGAIAQMHASFDTFCSGDEHAKIEIYGTEGNLRVPDPNGFGYAGIFLLRAGESEYRQIPSLFDYCGNDRGIGLADMAKALLTGRDFRCNYRQQLHVLELMKSFETASAERRVVTIESEYERSAPMLYPDIHGVLKD